MDYNTFGGFENQLGKATYEEQSERTRVDKLLSQSEINRLRDLVSKDLLDVEEIDEIMNILVSTELKLTNFNDNDRYILGKYLLWVTEYGKRYSQGIRARDYYKKQWNNLSFRTQQMRINIEKDYAGTFKQAVHTYCYLARSPLSIGGNLIDRLTSDKREMKYTGNSLVPGQIQNPGNFMQKQ